MKLILENTIKSTISEGLDWHIKNNIPLYENIYRIGSTEYFNLFNECRTLWNNGSLVTDNKHDIWFLNSNIGKIGLFESKYVLLDYPIVINEAEYHDKNVKLNSPSRSTGPKKYKVYVKSDSGNIVKVNFGDVTGGLHSKINDPVARKSFAERHDCKNKKDKTKPGYWSCNLPRYAKQLGLSGGGNYYW